jgi:hypothetical protein
VGTTLVVPQAVVNTGALAPEVCLSRNEKRETRNEKPLLAVDSPYPAQENSRAVETTFSSQLATITLPDADGHSVQLGSLWASNPALIVFLRHYG